MKQQNFIVCRPKFTNVSAFDVESIVVVNAVSRKRTGLRTHNQSFLTRQGQGQKSKVIKYIFLELCS